MLEFASGKFGKWLVMMNRTGMNETVRYEITPPSSGDSVARVASILEQARGNVVRSVNANMVLAYWQIGRENAAIDGEFPECQACAMGFEENWQDLPLWRETR